MRAAHRGLVLLAFLTVPVAALSDPAADDPAHAARRLERWRNDAEHYDRLRRDWRAFAALPPERQQQLRDLDRDLHGTDSVTQKRLWGVLDRYAAWLDDLPEDQRRHILETADPQARLALIRAARDAEWLRQAPRKVSDEVGRLPAEQRSAAIAKHRQEERQRELAWKRQLKMVPPRPSRPADLPDDVRRYLKDSLGRRLTAEEQQQLKKAEGHWPLYPLTLLEAHEAHPVLPPVYDAEKSASKVYTTYAQLPFRAEKDANKFKNRLAALKGGGEALTKMEKQSGKWPDFALAVTEVTRKDFPQLKGWLPPLGAAQPADFPPAVRQFIGTTLAARLTDDEKKQLAEAEGQWPEYPRLMRELAHKHHLVVPEVDLPGSRETWEAARNALPEVPDRVLREFALYELTAEERQPLLDVSDPASRDRLKQKYFQRYPQEHRRLIELDRQLLLRKTGAAKP